MFRNKHFVTYYMRQLLYVMCYSYHKSVCLASLIGDCNCACSVHISSPFCMRLSRAWMLGCIQWYDTLLFGMHKLQHIIHMILYKIFDIRHHQYMIWYNIWYNMIWYMIWYEIIWYMLWYDMVWYDMIYDTIRYDTIRNDMVWHVMWTHSKGTFRMPLIATSRL